MPTIFVSGDLFTKQGLSALGHGCNCAGVMGKGIAVEFRRRFPAMFEEYKKRCQEGRFVLGDVFAWSAPDGTTVFNLGTQRTWRTKAELPAIRVAVSRMIELAGEMGVLVIGLPRIGAGLGGLPWQDVKALLADLGSSTDIELQVFEEFVPAASGAG